MKLYNNEKGFTLIEILIVVMIIGIIAALAIPNLLSAQKTAWAKTCEANRSTIKAAAELYRMQSGALPASVTALTSSAAAGYDPIMDAIPPCPSGKTGAYSFKATGSSDIICSEQGAGKAHP